MFTCRNDRRNLGAEEHVGEGRRMPFRHPTAAVPVLQQDFAVATGAAFDPGYILSDDVLSDSRSLTKAQVQAFHRRTSSRQRRHQRHHVPSCPPLPHCQADQPQTVVSMQRSSVCPAAVQFSPQMACGAEVVNIRNPATAALYNYTPYQPNAAARANPRGQGDACSSYGNRNFWVFFTEWFGSENERSSDAGEHSMHGATFFWGGEHNGRGNRRWLFDQGPSVGDA